MKKLLYSIFFVLLCKISSGQIPKERKYFENPPLDSITILIEEIKKPDFDKIYTITKNELIEIIQTNSQPIKHSEGAYEGVRFFLNGEEYETSVSPNWANDLLGIFRKAPGDCGWYPNLINFLPFPGKEKDAKTYIEKNNWKIENDTLVNGEWYSSYSGDYFYYAFRVPLMMEEPTIDRLKATGLFLYVSREANECGGGDRGLITKRQKVFGTSQPDGILGLKFLKALFDKEVNKNVEVKIIPESDFYYKVILKGPSKYLSLKQNNLWELISIHVKFQNGFNINPDEMEILLSFEENRYAKGPDNVPPLPVRFLRYLDNLELSREDETDYQKLLISNLIVRTGGRSN